MGKLHRLIRAQIVRASRQFRLCGGSGGHAGTRHAAVDARPSGRLDLRVKVNAVVKVSVRVHACACVDVGLAECMTRENLAADKNGTRITHE